MRFLIAGLGSVGRRHLRNLWALGQRDIVLYRTGSSTLPKEELEGVPCENDLRAALARSPNAVIVANPTALHLEVAIPAAQAGCHLLIEKPVSHSLEGLPELAGALEERGGKVLIGFQYRFHPGLHRVKQILEEGQIGRALTAQVHWGEYLPGWHPWEDYRRSYAARSELGGGVLRTLCHPFDYLRWLLGEVVDVWGWTKNSGELEIDVEDIAEVGLRFETGALGNVHLDYLDRPGRHDLELVGTRGRLRWSSESRQAWVTREGDENRDTAERAQVVDRNDPFLAEIRHFVEVVEGRAEPVCTLRDGIRALEIVIAAERSAIAAGMSREHL